MSWAKTCTTNPYLQLYAQFWTELLKYTEMKVINRSYELQNYNKFFSDDICHCENFTDGVEGGVKGHLFQFMQALSTHK